MAMMSALGWGLRARIARPAAEVGMLQALLERGLTSNVILTSADNRMAVVG